MVCCAAFANFAKEMAPENEACKFQVDEAYPALLGLLRENLFQSLLREAALVYSGAKISLKKDDVPTLFPLVDVELTSVRRTTSLGSKASGRRKWTVTDTVSATFYLLT